MKKYEIIKNGLDDYTLKYKDKEFNFHSDIKTIKEMQSVYIKAEEAMIFSLVEKGKSVKELSKEEKKDGKTYIDNSNKESLKQMYVDYYTLEFMNNLFKKHFYMDYLDMMNDIGLEGDKEVEEFTSDIGAVFNGKTPSEVKIPKK